MTTEPLPDLRPSAPQELPAPAAPPDICTCDVARQVHDPHCPAYGPIPRKLAAVSAA